MKLKRMIALIIAFILCCGAFLLPAGAAYNSEVDVDANIAYLISLDKDNTVIYDKNSEVRFDPAAIVKIVTGIIVIENCSNLDQVIEAPYDSVVSVMGTGSSTAAISAGELMSIRDLLYCMLVYNAADAAQILADYITEDRDAFVAMMNDLAARLGCVNTHFTNAVGYDGEGQYTTAREIAAIYYYCVSNPTFDEIISTDYFEVEPTNKYGYTRYFKTTNGLMNANIQDYFLKYVKSGKSGVSGDNGCNSVSIASKDGYNYLCVIMDAPYADFDEDKVDENMSFVSAKKLYQWTFDNIRLRVVANPYQHVCEVKVKLSSEYDYVSLVPAEEISALVPAGVNAESLLPEPIPELTPEVVKAPIHKGDILGRATIKYAGEVVAEVDLAAAFDVRSNVLKWFGDLLLSLLKSTVFRIIFVVALAVAVVYGLTVFRNGKRSRKKSSVRPVVRKK